MAKMPDDYRQMDADEYRTAIDKLGLSQLAAARMLYIADRTSRAFALGETKVWPVVASLLRLMLKFRATPDDLAKLNSKGPKR